MVGSTGVFDRRLDEEALSGRTCGQAAEGDSARGPFYFCVAGIQAGDGDIPAIGHFDGGGGRVDAMWLSGTRMAWQLSFNNKLLFMAESLGIR